METIEEIETCEKMKLLIDSWMEDTEDNQEAQRIVERYYQKKKFSELSMKAVVYGFFTLAMVAPWLVTDAQDWNPHWIVKVFTDIGLFAMAMYIKCRDAVEYPDNIPTNREEEMLDKEIHDREMPEQEVSQINYEMENGELERCGEMEGREL